MDYPDFPDEFSEQARAAVIAAKVEAGRAIGNDRNFMKFILTVFLAFAKEACRLGRDKVWGMDRVDREAREFLRSTASHACYRYKHYGVPDMFSHMGHLETRFEAGFENTPQWHEYEDWLLEVGRAWTTGDGSGESVRESEPRKSPTASTPGTTEGQTQAKGIRKTLEPKPELLANLDSTLNRLRAAEALGVTPRSLDRWIADKKVTPVGLGPRKRFKAKDLRRILNERMLDKRDKQ